MELIVLILGKAADCAAGKDGGAAVGCKLNEYQCLAVGENATQVCFYSFSSHSISAH